MVASEKEEVLWVLDLVGEEKADRLEALLAAVDVVTEEEVVGLRWEATVLKEAEKVEVLAMDVSCKAGQHVDGLFPWAKGRHEITSKIAEAFTKSRARSRQKMGECCRVGTRAPLRRWLPRGC